MTFHPVHTVGHDAELDIIAAHGLKPGNGDDTAHLTTRSREVACSFAGTDMIELGAMPPAEARQLLDTSLQKKDIVQNHELEATELLDLLGYLPLAIIQAAAYLNQNRNLSIQGYVELFNKSASDKTALALISREFLERDDQHRAPVMATWLVSITQIRKIDPSAEDLLSFISCIEPREIHKAMLPVFQSEEVTEHAIETLCGYGFLNPREDGKVFDMHRLVHLAAISWTKGRGGLEEALAIAVENLASVFPPALSEHKTTWQRYLPHALRLLPKAESCNRGSFLTLLHNVGRCLLYDGRFREAVNCFEKAMGWLGRHDTEMRLELDFLRLATERNLALAYVKNKQIREAIKILDGFIPVQTEESPSEWWSPTAAYEYETARRYLNDNQIGEGLEILEGAARVYDHHLPGYKRPRCSPDHGEEQYKMPERDATSRGMSPMLDVDVDYSFLAYSFG